MALSCNCFDFGANRMLMSMKAMVALDTNGDGFISRSEFLRLADPEVISNSQSWIARL